MTIYNFDTKRKLLAFSSVEAGFLLLLGFYNWITYIDISTARSG